MAQLDDVMRALGRVEGKLDQVISSNDTAHAGHESILTNVLKRISSLEESRARFRGALKVAAWLSGAVAVSIGALGTQWYIT